MTQVREVVLAERIARAAHGGHVKRRTGELVIHHVERVVGMVDGDRARAVAWLHDVIEDTNLTADDLLRRGVSAAAVDAVLLLTREADVDYAKYIERIRASGNELARTVKIADLRDHLRPNCPPAKRPRYEQALAAFGEPSPERDG
jgi:(p)ppGpp synthase/HD superfamily hydrolase